MIIKENVAIPAVTTIQDCVTQIWNNERSRLVTAYYRYTLKAQRQSVLKMLDKTDDHYRIVGIKKDMKAFNTESIELELDKHAQLKSVFIIATSIIPTLALPSATIEYYAQLINY